MLIPHVPRPPPPRFVCRDREQVSTHDASLPHHTSDHSVMNCSHVVFSNLGIFHIALCPGLSVPCHLSHGGREGVKGSTPTKRQCWFAPTLLRVWDLRPRGGCFGNVSTSLLSLRPPLPVHVTRVSSLNVTRWPSGQIPWHQIWISPPPRTSCDPYQL